MQGGTPWRRVREPGRRGRARCCLGQDGPHRARTRADTTRATKVCAPGLAGATVTRTQEARHKAVLTKDHRPRTPRGGRHLGSSPCLDTRMVDSDLYGQPLHL